MSQEDPPWQGERDPGRFWVLCSPGKPRVMSNGPGTHFGPARLRQAGLLSAVSPPNPGCG